MVKVFGLILGIALLLRGSPAYCLKQLPMVNHHQTRIEISSHEMNRIAIKEDRIKQVFGMDDRLIIEVDEDSGQIFLKPRKLAFSSSFSMDKRRDNPRSINLTITTEKGLTHDLRLIPTSGASESVLFYQELEPSERQEKQKDRASRIVRFVREMEQGSPGLETVKLPLNQVDRCYGEYLHLKPLFQYNNGEFEGQVYLLQNVSKGHQILQEPGLAMVGDLAISVKHRSLALHQQTRLFVVKDALAGRVS